MNTKSQKDSNNKGIVLGVVLIILFAITLLGSSLVTSANLNQKIATNLQDENLAFQAAETAIAAAERWMSMEKSPFAPLKKEYFIAENKEKGLEGLHRRPIVLDEAIKKGEVFDLGKRPANRLAPPFVEGLDEVHRQPIFFIRLTKYVCDTDEPRAYFKILSRGWGKNPAVKVDLISRVSRRISCNSSAVGAGSDNGRVL